MSSGKAVGCLVQLWKKMSVSDSERHIEGSQNVTALTWLSSRPATGHVRPQPCSLMFQPREHLLSTLCSLPRPCETWLLGTSHLCGWLPSWLALPLGMALGHRQPPNRGAAASLLWPPRVLGLSPAPVLWLHCSLGPVCPHLEAPHHYQWTGSEWSSWTPLPQNTLKH